MASDPDEFTRKRIESESEPDYGLLLDIRGYRYGTEDRVRWRIEPLAWANIDPEDSEYLADVLEKVVEVIRDGETETTDQEG